MAADDDIIIAGKPVSLTEIRALLEREQGERGELSYEQKLALDHSTIFTRYPPEKALEMVGKLKGIGGKVTEWHAYKIADIAPTHPDDVRAIFQKDRVTPEKEEIDRIIEIVQSYL